MKKKCLIIVGGEYSPLSEEEIQQYDEFIACDVGWEYAMRMHIKPDLVMGDFDSAPQPETDVPIIKFPTRKDDTDTMLAIKHAMENGCDTIGVACAFGGRLDHAIANIQSAAYIVAGGGEARLYGVDTNVTAFRKKEIVFPRRLGWSLSVFALTDRCEGVTIRGTKFTCEEVTVENRFPIGVSNTWEEDNAIISVHSGILMVMESRLKKGEHI